jgi:O-antigen/teichoic acid export membrane protein
VTLFDLGIVNGLLNVVSEANGREDREGARAGVSCAFLLLTALALVLALGAVIATWLLPWESILASRGAADASTLRWTVGIALLSAVVGLPLSIVHPIYAGYQRGYVGAAFGIVGSLLTLAGVAIAVRGSDPLPAIALAFGGAGILINVLNLAYLFAREIPWVRPSVRAVSRPAVRRLMRSALPLFAFQLGALLVNQSQNLVLAHAGGLAVVADFSILLKLYVALMTVIAVSTSSFLPSLRESLEQGDAAWTRRTFARLLGIRMAMAGAACAFMLLAGNAALRVWLGAQISFGMPTWAALTVTCLTAVWGTAFVELMTILDRIWSQVGLVLLNGVLTLLLTAALGPKFGVLGGVIALGASATLVSSWALPWMARDIWRVGEGDRRTASGGAVP